ncbi:MAG: dienelactone hydrolase family protein [Acidobacteria bacterium]|nr:dienelactone hydrolase family protein [Acidobacteriota bacterium]
MHPIRSEWIELSAEDGTTFRAWAARPVGVANPPGLLVLQEVFGVNAHMRDITDRWAREGFLALCPELFHRTAPHFDAPYTELAAARAEAGKMTLEGLDADFRACAAWLAAQGAERQAAVGYCMGGRMAFLANTALPLRAAISCYGGMIPQHLDRLPALSGPHLFLWGGKDQAITWEQRPQVEAALLEAQKPFASLIYSEAPHGFFCDARPEHFHPESARQGWAASLAFLREHLN